MTAVGILALLGAFPSWLAFAKWRGADYNLNGIITPSEAQRFVGESQLPLIESGTWYFDVKGSPDHTLPVEFANNLSSSLDLHADAAIVFVTQQELGSLALFPYAQKPCVYENFEARRDEADTETHISGETRCNLSDNVNPDTTRDSSAIYSGTPGFMNIWIRESCLYGWFQSLGSGTGETTANTNYKIFFRASKSGGCPGNSTFDTWLAPR